MFCAALLIKFVPDFNLALELPLELRISLAIFFVVIGLSIDVSAILSFRKAKTTINPLKPHATSKLVENGIYRFTRNPMYLGMVFILLGVLCYYANPIGLIVIIIFMVFITQFQIIPEERAMSELFENRFSLYRQQVRRWL